MNCILKDGCPCTNTSCPRHGNCVECIKRHFYETDAIVACMREKAQEIYSASENKD